MPSIGEVLHRRSDLSTFVVHLTKDVPGGASAVQNLVTILNSGRIEARAAMGWSADEATALGGYASQSQRVVCFSETPLEQIYSLVAEIPNRQVHLRPYGLAFTKMIARRKGANPVWYVDKTWGRHWDIGLALDALRQEAVHRGAAGFHGHPASKLFPFFESMRNGWPATPMKEFWWEREWRHVGDFVFQPTEVALIIAPEDIHATLQRNFTRPVIDGMWSLERMIASLAGLAAGDVTPFSP